MNEIEELLAGAVSEHAGFGTDEVQARVRTRARRRRAIIGAAGVALLALVAGVAVALTDGEGDERERVASSTTAVDPTTLDGEVSRADLVDTDWELASIDDVRYEKWADGWGGSIEGLASRPSLSFEPTFLGMYTGCNGGSYDEWGVESGALITIEEAGFEGNACSAMPTRLGERFLAQLADGSPISLVDSQLVIGTLTFRPRPIDFDPDRYRDWQLATIDGAPAAAFGEIGPGTSQRSSDVLAIATCPLGQVRFTVDRSDTQPTLAPSEPDGPYGCDYPAPVQALNANVARRLVLPATVTEATADRLAMTGDLGTMTFGPPPTDRRSGLVGDWEPIWVLGSDAAPDLDLGLSFDGSTVELSGCALGYGPGYRPEIDRRVLLGEETSTVDYDCTAPSAEAVAQADAFHEFLLGGPELTVWPNAVIFHWNGREAVFVRTDVDQAVDMQLTWFAVTPDGGNVPVERAIDSPTESSDVTAQATSVPVIPSGTSLLPSSTGSRPGAGIPSEFVIDSQAILVDSDFMVAGARGVEAENLMQAGVTSMLGWLKGDDFEGPDVWLADRDIWIGGIGVYADAPTPMNLVPADGLRTIDDWNQPRGWNMGATIDCFSDCLRSVYEFLGFDGVTDDSLGHDAVAEGVELRPDDIEPGIVNFNWYNGGVEHLAAVSSVTIDKPAAESGGGDWQRIHVLFDWSDGTPRIFGLYHWGWTP
ncbi:MAG: META domain-containing protein [Acidimicrobiia bacterium]|nr:META domain-containing protein [Acidimicrobiia bacterium]